MKKDIGFIALLLVFCFIVLFLVYRKNKMIQDKPIYELMIVDIIDSNRRGWVYITQHEKEFYREGDIVSVDLKNHIICDTCRNSTLGILRTFKTIDKP